MRTCAIVVVVVLAGCQQAGQAEEKIRALEDRVARLEAAADLPGPYDAPIGWPGQQTHRITELEWYDHFLEDWCQPTPLADDGVRCSDVSVWYAGVTTMETPTPCVTLQLFSHLPGQEAERRAAQIALSGVRTTPDWISDWLIVIEGYTVTAARITLPTEHEDRDRIDWRAAKELGLRWTRGLSESVPDLHSLVASPLPLRPRR